MSRAALVQAAVAGPAVAGGTWLALTLQRRRWVRRVVPGLVALAAHGAAWAVFWLAYQGEPATWRSFGPGLLGATVAVAAEVSVLLVALRAEGLGRLGAPVAVVGLGVATSAVVATAYGTNLPVQAVLLPLPTAAAAVAALAGRDPIDLRGLVGLAASDVVAVVGLAVAQARTEAAEVGPSAGAAAVLLLVAGAAKAGALPGLATWRLAAHRGPIGVVSVAVRAQGVALAAVGGLLLGGGESTGAVTGVAAGVLLLAGAAAAGSRDEAGVLAAVIGTAAVVPFLALGLGGPVGTRAFLVLFPGFLVGAGTATLLAWPGREAPARAGAGWRWLGAASLGAAALSVLGFPPGAGFPGTWLALSLAGLRAEAQPAWLLVLGGGALGLALAGLAAVPLIRSARPGPLRAVPAALASVALLYMGTQPVRLGVGWWLRIEEELGTPVVLSSTGAPDLPPLGGLNLLLVLGEAAALVALVVLLGRGFRDARPPFVPTASGRAAQAVRRTAGGLGRALDRGPVAIASRWVWARRDELTLVAVGTLEVAAVVLVVRVVVIAARSGFL